MSKKTKYESESESEFEYEYESESDDEKNYQEIIEETLGESIYTTPNYNGYFPTLKNFLSDNIHPYCFNNKINKDHMNQISTKIIRNKGQINGVFITAFSIAQNKIYLLDGHHRHKALQKAYQKDKHIKQHIHVFNYIIDDIYDVKTREWFNSINRVKPFNNDEDYLRHAHNIISKLKSRYPNCLKDDPTKQTSHKPYVYLPDVLNALKLYFKENKLDNIEDDAIFDKLVIKNDAFEYMTYDELQKKCKKLTKKQYDKMEKLGFYLSMVDPYDWFD